jgi:hypothetical protein
MKRIAYANGSFVTGDRISDALLDYAATLARAGQADRVTIPAVGTDDALRRFDLVVGPASQLIAEPVEFAGEELADDALVADLEHRGRLARAGRLGELGGGRSLGR